MSETIIVKLADGRVVKRGETLVTYALGSCVGICLYDQLNRVAGMAHIMLPSIEDARSNDCSEYKYADSGVKKLVEEMIRAGAYKRNIDAKIFGGAEMFPICGHSMRVGERNVDAVKRALMDELIPLIASDTGQNYGRTIWLNSQSGMVRVKSVKKEIYK